MIEATQPHVERARAIVEAEREIVAAELDAFETFLARLQEIQPESTARTSITDPVPEGDVSALSGMTIRSAHGGQTDELEAVRTAYRETVMDTPHYDREYGDTLAESLATEASEALAEHVTQGGTLRPPVHDALVEAARDARDDRRRFLSTLRRERESLEAAECELNEIEQETFSLQKDIPGASSEQLATIDGRLQALERRDAELARRRQERIHDRPGRYLSGVDGTSLVAYLYGETGTRCPVLADATECLETIRHHRQRCLR